MISGMIDNCCFSVSCLNVFLVGHSCISDAAYEEPDEQMENGGFSSWPGQHCRRGYSHIVRPSAPHLGSQPGSHLGSSSCPSVRPQGTRKAAPSRRNAPYWPTNCPQRWNHRFGGRVGPMRRQNHRGNQSGEPNIFFLGC